MLKLVVNNANPEESTKLFAGGRKPWAERLKLVEDDRRKANDRIVRSLKKKKK